MASPPRELESIEVREPTETSTEHTFSRAGSFSAISTPIFAIKDLIFVGNAALSTLSTAYFVRHWVLCFIEAGAGRA